MLRRPERMLLATVLLLGCSGSPASVDALKDGTVDLASQQEVSGPVDLLDLAPRQDIYEQEDALVDTVSPLPDLGPLSDVEEAHVPGDVGDASDQWELVDALVVDIGADIVEMADETVDCEALCAPQECGPAGPDGQCDCGGCTGSDPCLDPTCIAGECHGVYNSDACDDGNPCTDNDACHKGICQGELLPMEQLLQLACTCETDSDCDFLDDGDACNGILHCAQLHSHKVCAVAPDSVIDCDDSDWCTIDLCEPKTGACINEAVTCDDEDPCTDDACNPDNGQCVHEDADCDDGDECTDDLCELEEGGCLHISTICDDDDKCTEDWCNPETGACQYLPKQCDDGDACTLDDCNGLTGDCFNLALNCDDGNLCTTDSCEPGTGACLHDGMVCPSGSGCLGGTCNPSTGQCEPLLSCDDGNPCTDDICLEDGTCSNEMGLGTMCSEDAHCFNADGNACTKGSCSLSGCVCGSTSVDCNDGNVSTNDYCDPVSGCKHIETDCSGGSNPCAGWTVDPETGDCYYHVKNCSDGDLCTEDLCSWSTGACMSVPKCIDDDPCTTDYCDPESGDCSHEDKCDDGDPLTTDICELDTGLCINSHEFCDDFDVCTVDSLDPDTGECLYAPADCGLPPPPCWVQLCNPVTGCYVEEKVCDDGNPCTADYCKGDGCKHTQNVCTDGDACTADICDPADLSCTFEPKQDFEPCYDAFPGLLQCVGGACVCVPDCDGKECGFDACEGTCGECEGETYCAGGSCVPNCGNGVCAGPETCENCVVDCGECSPNVEWVALGPDQFIMGCTQDGPPCPQPELPPHTVTVLPFELMTTEVTQAQYLLWQGDLPTCGEGGEQGDDQDEPVVCVSQEKAADFCEWLNARLPSEAEWEYAAQAGASTVFPCGDDPTCLPATTVYAATSGGELQPVDSKPPNSYGLYGMTGNISEWVADDWHPDYDSASSVSYPPWSQGGGLSVPVVRGGHYLSPFYQLRTSYRAGYDANSSPFVGFRCARSVD